VLSGLRFFVNTDVADRIISTESDPHSCIFCFDKAAAQWLEVARIRRSMRLLVFF
jgi:hypothetical protein